MLLLVFISGIKCGSHKSLLWPHSHSLRGSGRSFFSSFLPPCLSPSPHPPDRHSSVVPGFPLCIKITCFPETQGAKVLGMSVLDNIQVIVPTLQMRKLT